MEILYPDYNNSIVNLSCSVLKYYKAPIRHNSLDVVDIVLNSRKPRNIVIMLFDGMGISILERHLSADSFIRSHLVKTITSTFPPTTVAATTAINTGLTPLETGWLGWITYFKEVDSNVVTFFNTIQNTKIPASDGNLAKETLPYRTLSMQIKDIDPNIRCSAIAPFVINSHDTIYISSSVSESCDKILELTKEGNNFIYSYWDNPDDLMHEFGVDDTERITPVVKEIDANLKRLSQSLGDDTVVFVTADHSQINSKWLYLSDYPDLKNLLVRDHGIEFRAASLWIKEGKKEEFRVLFERYLGSHFVLMDHDTFLSSGLLGNGVPHPRTDGFVGDFIAISKDEYCINDQRFGKELVGIHAGLTKQEMEVPLILL